ncbi:alpha/beta fold hydrolase [Georgenia alba]|uniref:Alpha/beta fold hydrolase n=1 Tax=Georgenia alba TaxID=2233858 RepID=A0ABW2Q508_9MICO
MSDPVDVVLVPGFWLGGWAWDGVAPYLAQHGIRPHPVTLPGRRPGPVVRTTLEHHVAALREVVAGLDGAVVLVGHSAGATSVNALADAMPDRIDRLVFVDDGPLPDGGRFPFELPGRAKALPLPAWPELERMGLSTAGIDPATLAEFRRRAVAEPIGVVRTQARWTNPARKQVPATVLCCSTPGGVLNEAVRDGAPFTAELAGRDLTLVDLPTGHWPMFSRPQDLAAAIHLATTQ